MDQETEKAGPHEFGEIIQVEAPLQPLTEPVEAQREKMRGFVALALLALLSAEVILSLATYWFVGESKTKVIADWLTVVISPTVALLGAATGFYYGADKK